MEILHLESDQNSHTHIMFLCWSSAFKWEILYFYLGQIVTSLAKIFTVEIALFNINFGVVYGTFRTFRMKKDGKILFVGGCFRTR